MIPESLSEERRHDDIEASTPPESSGIRDPVDSGEEPIVRLSGRRRRRTLVDLFPQLFLIPLLLVTVGVLVVLLFNAIARDSRAVSDILRDMQSAGPKARARDALQVVQALSERNRGTPGRVDYLSVKETELLIRILEKHPDDKFTNEFVIKALGLAGQPAVALPKLEELVESSDRGSLEGKAALTALGFTRSPEAVDILLEELRELRGVDRWESRLLAIRSLVQIEEAREDDVASGRIREALRRHVDDPQREVSWNTAYYLARYFDDASGAHRLRRLLDIEFLEAQRGERNRELTDREKRDWMIQAVKGLHAVDPAFLRQHLDEVRSVARKRRWPELLNVVEEHEELLEKRPASAGTSTEPRRDEP